MNQSRAPYAIIETANRDAAIQQVMKALPNRDAVANLDSHSSPHPLTTHPRHRRRRAEVGRKVKLCRIEIRRKTRLLHAFHLPYAQEPGAPEEGGRAAAFVIKLQCAIGVDCPHTKSSSSVCAMNTIPESDEEPMCKNEISRIIGRRMSPRWEHMLNSIATHTLLLAQP